MPSKGDVPLKGSVFSIESFSKFSVFSWFSVSKSSRSSDWSLDVSKLISSDLPLSFNLICAAANWSLICSVWKTSVSLASATSQNSSLATPCKSFLTLSGLSTPGSSICILPVPWSLWILGCDVPNLSILVLKILKDLSIALSTSLFIISIISSSVESKPILPLFETVAKINDSFFWGAKSWNSV